jgi:nucleoside-diphosphate-sugar epimerase
MLLDAGYNIVQIDGENYGRDIFRANLWKYDPDYIVHLAAISGIQSCQEDKENAVRHNVLASQVIANYACEREIPVIFTSSQAVKNPESSVYAMTKFIAEETFNTFCDATILRLSNVFGGEKFVGHKTSIVAKWLSMIEHDKFPLLINGDGTQGRDFVHVEDVCRVMINVIEKGIWNVTMDVGTGRETTINELASYFKPLEDRKGCGIFAYFKESGAVGTKSSIADVTPMERKGIMSPERSVKGYIEHMIKSI